MFLATGARQRPSAITNRPEEGRRAQDQYADLVLHEPEHAAVAMAPAGQLWPTSEDLARWSEVLNGARPEVLNARWAEEMTEPIGLVDVAGHPWNAAYGLGALTTTAGAPTDTQKLM